MNEALINSFDAKGFEIIDKIYSDKEVADILHAINETPLINDKFRKTDDLFAIRQFLKQVPAVSALIFNDNLISLISQMFGDGYFVTKSIYFDKPPKSNWFVAYHQDLTISVDKKIELEGYGPWTVKQNQFAVQPPLEILQSNFTIRIHLDDTDENNGALKVIEGSNLKGVYRAETIDFATETEKFCRVQRGGVMLMKPLLLHASNRSTNNSSRRVIHIEFSKSRLPVGICWSEKFNFN